MSEIDDLPGCREYNQFSRREFMKKGVQVGVLSALGLGMTEYFSRGEASAAGVDGGTATSAVLIWMGGGPSHLDTWDLKPNAPIRDSRDVQPDRYQRARRPDQRASAQNGESHGQGVAHPLDDQPRSGARARDALHDDGLPAASGLWRSRLRLGRGEVSADAVGAAALYRRAERDHVRRRGLSGRGAGPLRAGRRPEQRRLQGTRPGFAERHDGRAYAATQDAARVGRWGVRAVRKRFRPSTDRR